MYENPKGFRLFGMEKLNAITNLGRHTGLTLP